MVTTTRIIWLTFWLVHACLLIFATAFKSEFVVSRSFFKRIDGDEVKGSGLDYLLVRYFDSILLHEMSLRRGFGTACLAVVVLVCRQGRVRASRW